MREGSYAQILATGFYIRVPNETLQLTGARWCHWVVRLAECSHV